MKPTQCQYSSYDEWPNATIRMTYQIATGTEAIIQTRFQHYHKSEITYLLEVATCEGYRRVSYLLFAYLCD